MSSVRLLILVFAIAASGWSCAPRARSATRIPQTAPSTAPSNATESLALDQILPAPVFETPATQPAGDVPLAAIELFARARDARLRNQPYTSISLIEQAIKLDPDSFELYFALGSTCQRVGSIDRAIEAYKHAERIKPQDLVLQAELGRAYMQRRDVANGIRHLRLARMTDDYRRDETMAAAVDYRLGLALQEGGYDHAALEVYDALLGRLKQPSSAMRANADIALLMNRPEFLVEQLGRLYEKSGRWDEALRSYEFVAQQDRADFTARSRVVQTLLSMGRTDDAIHAAGKVVVDFNASSDSLRLLRDAYTRAGRQAALVEELRRFHQQHPGDRSVLFALADAMQAAGQSAESQQLLADAAERRHGDAEILRRLVKLLSDDGRLSEAARILIEEAAERPQNTSQLLPLWSIIASPGRNPTLRVNQMQSVPVSAEAQAAKLFFQSRVAETWNHSNLARTLLEQAVAARPPFAPAFAEMINEIWTEPGWDDDQKRQATDVLTRSIPSDSVLAARLKGMALLAQKKYRDAEAALSDAVRLGDRSPELLLTQAIAVRSEGNTARFEQLMSRLINAHPQYSAAYSTLFRHHLERNNLALARKVGENWIANMPDDPEARMQQAVVELRFNGRPDEARRILLDLFAEYPDRPDVLGTLRVVYGESGQAAVFTQMLENEVAAHPFNFPALLALVEIYGPQRVNESMSVLDASRAALKDDPDRLYFIAHLYTRIDQPRLSEQVLEEVLRADPSFAAAANDLGYTLADSDRDLDRAESLVRRAVEVEPSNPMFLDSLGWVLYKRGQIGEARRFLEQAVAGARAADPVVLDHLGDALYRLNEQDLARRNWELAQSRIPEAADRQDLNALKLKLQQKLKQLEQDQPVSVAPSTHAAPAGQAKN